jgi:hypothetical protein
MHPLIRKRYSTLQRTLQKNQPKRLTARLIHFPIGCLWKTGKAL